MGAKYNVKGFAFIGRTFDEYCRMFNLTEDELKNNTFLDCPGGACSFTAEARKKGIIAQASDCEYGNPVSHFEKSCQLELDKVKDGFANAESLFNWSFYGELDQLLLYRQKAARLFVQDYHKNPKSYTKGILPNLPFPNNAFDIVLSGHFLFLYADRLDYNFHRNALLELTRVAKKEVRVYPLIGLDGSAYADMDKLLYDLSQTGAVPKLIETDFEFLKGSNQCLLIQKDSRNGD
jgi:hypothetical protein